MKEQDIKRSIDFISVDQDKKDEIFNNIVNKKAETKKTPKIYYIRFATTMAAAFVLLFGVYHVTTLFNFNYGSDGSTAEMETAGTMDGGAEEAETDTIITEGAVPEAVEEATTDEDYDTTDDAAAPYTYTNQRSDLMSVSAFRAYYPNSDEVFVIEDAGEDMFLIWNTLTTQGVYPDDISLENIEKSEDTLTLYFSKELQEITDEQGDYTLANAISESFLLYHFDVSYIEIFCGDNQLSLNGKTIDFNTLP